VSVESLKSSIMREHWKILVQRTASRRRPRAAPAVTSGK